MSNPIVFSIVFFIFCSLFSIVVVTSDFMVRDSTPLVASISKGLNRGMNAIFTLLCVFGAVTNGMVTVLTIVGTAFGSWIFAKFIRKKFQKPVVKVMRFKISVRNRLQEKIEYIKLFEEAGFYGGVYEEVNNRLNIVLFTTTKEESRKLDALLEKFGSIEVTKTLVEVGGRNYRR